MTITEKVSYLKGLAEGMELDAASKEVKLLNAIIDVLDDMAFEISDTQEVISELGEQVDMIDEDLDTLEEVVYEDYDECEDCDCDCDDCDCDCDCDDCDCDDDLYEVTCPTCGDSIYLDVDMVKEGSIDCPGCGEHLEFDLDELDAEDVEE